MKIFKPPQQDLLMPRAPVLPKTVFLAGSIENGTAENWQTEVELLLEDTNWTIYNPRRDNWDATLEQTKENAQFQEQVLWELKHLEKARVVIFYFDSNTKSPITLLELGLIGGRYPEKCIVICNEPFYRKGNVDIVCEQYGIKQVDSLEEATDILKCYAN